MIAAVEMGGGWADRLKLLCGEPSSLSSVS